MCLVTADKNRYTAEEDIVVYKILKEDLTSECWDFQYELEKQYSNSLVLQNCISFYCDVDQEHFRSIYGYDGNSSKELISIAKGFHSLGNIKLTKEIFERYHKEIFERYHKNSSYRKFVIVECIIPKGSKYYKNELDMYVSNRIIIVKKIENGFE